MARMVLHPMARPVSVLTLAAFLALTTGLTQAIHLHHADPDHHAEDCGLCAAMVGSKAAVTPTGEWSLCHPDGGAPCLPAPLDVAAAVTTPTCITLRGPPIV